MYVYVLNYRSIYVSNKKLLMLGQAQFVGSDRFQQVWCLGFFMGVWSSVLVVEHGFRRVWPFKFKISLKFIVFGFSPTLCNWEQYYLIEENIINFKTTICTYLSTTVSLILCMKIVLWGIKTLCESWINNTTSTNQIQNHQRRGGSNLSWFGEDEILLEANQS